MSSLQDDKTILQDEIAELTARKAGLQLSCNAQMARIQKQINQKQTQLDAVNAEITAAEGTSP